MDVPNKSLPIFKLLIDDNNDEGVDYVALVDHPAIERNWVAFSKAKQQFQVADTEKRIISGALMVANLPIYRKDQTIGEYYAVFDTDTIYKIVQRYFKKGFTGNVNLMHDPSSKVDGVYMFESYVIDRERGVRPPKGFEGITDGSWFGSYKVDNDKVWDDFIKTGELKGFSVEGVFGHEPYVEQTEGTIQEIINVINSIK